MKPEDLLLPSSKCIYYLPNGQVLFAEGRGVETYDEGLGIITFDLRHCALLTFIPDTRGNIGVQTQRADGAYQLFFGALYTCRLDQLRGVQSTCNMELVKNARKVISGLELAL